MQGGQAVYVVFFPKSGAEVDNITQITQLYDARPTENPLSLSFCSVIL